MTRKYTKRRQTTANIALDKDIVKKAEEILARRGTDIKTFLEVTLRAFVKIEVCLNLEDIMSFGKYTDVKVEDAARCDPDYFVWLFSKGRADKFDPEVWTLVERLTGEQLELDV